MAAYNKFDIFVLNVGNALHNLSSDTLRVLLTNTLPVAGDTVVDTTTTPCTVKAVSNAVEVAAASGYVKKGPQATLTSFTQTSGTSKLILAQVVITAGAAIGPFQYVVLYDDTTGTTATRPVIAWFNYGSSISLANGETFTVAFDGTNGVLTLN